MIWAQNTGHFLSTCTQVKVWAQDTAHPTTMCIWVRHEHMPSCFPITHNTWVKEWAHGIILLPTTWTQVKVRTQNTGHLLSTLTQVKVWTHDIMLSNYWVKRLDTMSTLLQIYDTTPSSHVYSIVNTDSMSSNEPPPKLFIPELKYKYTTKSSLDTTICTWVEIYISDTMLSFHI